MGPSPTPGRHRPSVPPLRRTPLLYPLDKTTVAYPKSWLFDGFKNDDAIAGLARFAVMVNEQTENIGARRLHTILERVLDENDAAVVATAPAVTPTPKPVVKKKPKVVSHKKPKATG